MAVWKLYCCISLLLNLKFMSSSLFLSSFDVSVDLTQVPFPIDVILAFIIVMVVSVIRFAVYCAVATSICHTLWLLAGSCCLWWSIHHSHAKLHNNQSFLHVKPRWSDSVSLQKELEPACSNSFHLHAAPLICDRREDLYEDLRENEGQIRLLRPVFERRSDSYLFFEMVHAPLEDDRTTYTALSYCWGVYKPDKTIFIKTQQRAYIAVVIRSNLYRALRRMIDLGIKFIWVDAICINQSNTIERDKQILRMGSIFTAAEMVMVWAPQTQSNDECTDGESEIAGRYSSSEQHDRSGSVSQWIDHLFDSDYWGRLWIVQEFALARRIQIHTETNSIDEPDLQELSNVHKARGHCHRAQLMENLLAIRLSCRINADPGLLDLLLRTSNNSSTNRHDRVFGILALAIDGRRFLLEPRYGDSTDKLCTKMTRSYLLSGGDSAVDIILLGSYCRGLCRLPSWSPDYFRFDRFTGDRRLMEYVCQGINPSRGYTRHVFRASGDSVCKVEFENGNILRTPAIVVGTIESLGFTDHKQNVGGELSKAETSFCTFNANAVDAMSALWNLYTCLVAGGFLENSSHSTGTFEASRKRGKERSDCMYPICHFMLGAFGGLSATVSEIHKTRTWYARWLLANQRFRFGRRTLHELAHATGLQILQKHFWSWSTSFNASMHFSSFHNELRQWKDLHQPLIKIAEQRMLLAGLTIRERGPGVIGLVHPEAQVHDVVTLLAGCSVPVILRKVAGSDRFSVVGDAFIPGVMQGELWSTKSSKIEII